MYEAAVITSVVLLLVSAADYVRRAWKGETKPVLATWILLTVMMSLSLWMYYHSDRMSWTANVGVTAGFVNVLMILIGIVATNLRNRTLHLAFDPVQRWCLLGGAGVLLFWFVTEQPLLSYGLVQLIALIAYVATVKRLWHAKASTEPLFLWTAVLTANLCAIYPAWTKHDPFSMIYLVRAVPATAGMIYLIARIKRRAS